MKSTDREYLVVCLTSAKVSEIPRDGPPPTYGKLPALLYRFCAAQRCIGETLAINLARKMMSETPIVLNVHMQAASGREQDLETQLRSLLAPTRNEAGCLAYECTQRPGKPQQVWRFTKNSKAKRRWMLMWLLKSIASSSWPIEKRKSDPGGIRDRDAMAGRRLSWQETPRSNHTW